MLRIADPYTQALEGRELEPTVLLVDHLNGFDANYHNPVLAALDQSPDCERVIWHQYLEPEVRARYTNLQIEFSAQHQHSLNFDSFHDYRQHPDPSISKFLCSFSGTPHVGRKFLVSSIQRFGWFDADTCSKNFSFTVDQLDGHLRDYLDPQRHRFYRPFFIGDSSPEFFGGINSFGHVQYDHAANIHNLEHRITRCFLHVVSETLPTGHCPFVTEKFLYSIITRGLFLAYAQPGWHAHLEKYYGFKKYHKIFDYRFDEITNPVERLVELMSAISKFSVLSPDDWRDLYEMEVDTIEYNYDWYFSKQYLSHLEQFSS